MGTINIGVVIVTLVSYKKNGFTLVEVFIVLAVLAVVSSVSVSYYRDYIDDAKRSVRKTNEKMVNDALNKYYKEHMTYPKYMWKNDSVEDIHKNINRGLDIALASYFANKKVSEILSEGSDYKGNEIFYLVTEPRKRDSEIGNVDNTSEVGKWKLAKNLRIETKDYLVNEIRIAENESGITASTFDNLERYNFPLKPNTEPISNTDTSYNSVSVDTEFDIQMVCCPAGKFLMGAPLEEKGRRDNENPHWVTLTKSFLIGKYEVTQKQYKKVMGTNPAYFNSDEMRPVETVTYNNALEFCNKLNTEYSRFVPYGYKFDLPTEAQWEYACRAGTTSALNNGKELTAIGENDYCENLDEVAWFKKSKNSNSNPHFVGDPRKQPNAWGIYDMHGNVHELIKDLRQVNNNIYPGYPSEDAVDPLVTVGNQNCRRGGCYTSPTYRCRSASRDGFGKNSKDKTTGFRVVLVQTDD